MVLVIDSAKLKVLKHEGIAFQNKFGKLAVHSQVASIYTLLDTDPYNLKRKSKDDVKTFKQNNVQLIEY